MSIDVAAPVRSAVRPVMAALLSALVLIEAELFLTADSESPNTWAGVVTDTVIVLVSGAVALGLVAASRRAPLAVGWCSLVAALLFSLPFWAGGAITLGVATYVLNRGRRQWAATTGVVLAGLQAAYLLVSVLIDFGPGLPA